MDIMTTLKMAAGGVALFAFGAVECFLAGNTGGGMTLLALASTLLLVKLRASAHA